jgi:hypothetical protein
MKHHRVGPRIPIRSMILPVLAGLWAVSLWGQEAASPDGRGFFLSLSGQQLDLQGDLGGELTLWHFEKAFFVPRLNKDFGLGLGVGFRSESGLWEFNVLYSNQRALWSGTESRASIYVLEINGWGFPWKHSVLQGYYLLGLCFPFLIVRDGSRMASSIFDAAYTGLGVNVGAGLILNLGHRLFISGGVKYRFIGFFYVNGGGKGRDIQDLTVGYQGSAWGQWLRAPSLGLTFGVGLIL